MKRYSIFFLIMAILSVSACGAYRQGQVVLNIPSQEKRTLPESKKSTPTLPSPQYAPSPYSPEYILRIFNPHPYPAKVIIGMNEEYLAPTQKMDVYFQKGIESRYVYIYAIFLDPDTGTRHEEMKSIGVREGGVRIPARKEGESEGSFVLGGIREFRYLRKKK